MELAQIMTKVATEAFRYKSIGERQKKLVSQILKREGIHTGDLFYIERQNGRTSLCLTLDSVKGSRKKASEIAGLVSVALNKRLSSSFHNPCQVEEEPRLFELVEEPSFVVMTGAARATKENEVCSGDNYAFYEPECGRMTALLADGAGSGETAGEESGRILDLMEKLIEADFALESAISLVNSGILAQGEERDISTLDVCDINLYEGICEFYKIGAAASFVKREYLVEQIESHCLPLGVLHPLESEMIRCHLMDGDYIIMMTDGVLDALGQNHYEEAMKHMIGEMRELNPREMAERIMRFALTCSGGRILDDMTVLVLGIWEKK